MKFGWETFKQVTHGNISIDLPQCINDLHALMFIVKKLKMIFLKKLFLFKHFVYFLVF
jgi:hypothetical protein